MAQRLDLRWAVERARFEGLEARCLFAIPPLPPLSLPEGFEQTVFARGVNTPSAEAFAPDGRLFVAEKGGKLRVIRADGQLLADPFVTVPAFTDLDMGLVGMIFDPAFAQNRYVYLYYTTKRTDGALVNRLSRFTADAANPDVAAAGSERVILESPMSGIHTGGAMGFGADGMLYLGTGDGTLASTPQDLGDLRGKVLRIDVRDGATLIPADNPFAGASGARGEIWAVGFRNPFSGAMRPGTNQFYVNDVGENTWEEVDNVVKGGNYGWPAAEGQSTDPRFVNPVHVYKHVSAGTSITGGTFYTGGQFPSEYAGNYLFSDYLNAFITRIDGGGQARGFVTGADRPVDLDVGPDGSLYYVSELGSDLTGANRPVYRIRYVGTPNPPPPPPPPPLVRGPFSGTPVALPGVIQAEDFDTGAEGVAFHDTTAANEGGLAYRGATPVDLQAAADAGGGATVGFVRAGEWLEYTVKVGATGSYDIDFRVAAMTAGGKFHLNVDGVNVTGSMAVPNTGGWQKWTTVTKARVSMTAGTHVFRLAFDTAGSIGYVGNFNFIQVRPAATVPPPPGGQTPFSGTPIVPPAVIEAENFDNGGEGVAYHDTTPTNTVGAYRATGVDVETTADAGGGYAIGYVKAGEWVEYTIDVSAAGNYDLDVRLAALGAGGQFHVQANGVNKTGSIVVPDTGAWQNWRTVTLPRLSLAAGRQVLRVAFDVAGRTSYVMNLNWLRLRAS